MLRLARVTADDVVYDLGSGDGRLVIDAARRFGARGVGVEIEPDLVQQSRENALKAGVADRVRFLWQDLFAADLRDVTVVTLYLRDDVNLRLRPKLLHELRPGSRVVSHDFAMAEWEPDRTLRVRGPDREHRVLLWTVPARVDGEWTLQIARAGATPARLRARQRFQRFDGTLDTPEGALPVLAGRLDGGRIEFRTAGAAGPAMRFTGRIAGDRAEGTVDLLSAGAAPRAHRWTAVRAP
jgi:SAM-dependent methyltransferase